jgi:hypothetical protein
MNGTKVAQIALAAEKLSDGEKEYSDLDDAMDENIPGTEPDLPDPEDGDGGDAGDGGEETGQTEGEEPES